MRRLEIHRADNSRQKDTAMAAIPKSVLEAFEYIVELAENSNLSDEFFERAAMHIKFVMRKLKLTPKEIVLLALFVDRSEKGQIYMSDIAQSTGCRTTRFLRMAEDIDSLEEKGYLRAARRRGSVTYRVPSEVLTAIRKGEPYTYVAEQVTDTQTFFDRFNVLAQEKDDDELTYDHLTTRTLEMLEEIKTTVFARLLNSFRLGNDELMLFIFMAHLFIENSDDNIRFSDIEDLYDDETIPLGIKRHLREHTSPLFSLKLIENINEDGMSRSDSYKLTGFAKEEILSELRFSEIGRSSRGLIDHNTLSGKELVYNDTEMSQISELSSILTHERFADVQSRLEKAGMRKGFCCLFYGAPGTGKTETVYQLARRTGRDIMQVDIDKIKSCWVGESEKNIKTLFDRYRSICSNTTHVPILLFNEADAVLGVRMEGASRAVDKMENSIQNIILQEMESLNGIMIATTNLTTNLDKAFERRFLYKIRFDKPSNESRAKIWQIMVPTLSAEDARALSVEFDLSGGEIENIARRHSVNAILTGCEQISLEDIKKLCLQEKISQNSRPRLGF